MKVKNEDEDEDEDEGEGKSKDEDDEKWVRMRGGRYVVVVKKRKYKNERGLIKKKK